MSSRTRSRKQASIGSNHSLRRPTPISASAPRTGNFVLLFVMACSPPAHNAGNVRVSAPGDYVTFNSNHTPDGTGSGRPGAECGSRHPDPLLRRNVVPWLAYHFQFIDVGRVTWIRAFPIVASLNCSGRLSVCYPFTC